MTKDLRVTIRDMRKAKMCSRGARAFALRHGLDWSAFLSGGVPIEQLEATKDAMALKLCKYVREENT